MSKTKDTPRMPIKDEPFPLAGESLRQRIDDELMDQVFFWILFVVIFAGLAIFEWMRLLFKMPLQPWPFTFAAIVVFILAFYRLRKAKEVIRRLTLGLRGEVIASQFFHRELAADHYQIIDDIQEENFNIDHVLIGPTGVYCVETKFWSLPESGEGKIEHDGRDLWINGYKEEGDTPIRQASRNAEHIESVIKKRTGLEYLVQPVVFFPGRQITRKAKNGPVWVVSFTGLIQFLQHEDARLSEETINALSRSLREYARDKSIAKSNSRR